MFAPPSPQCVVKPWGRHQEAEVKGYTTRVRILCFPEVFLWSHFLLRSKGCCLLFEQWCLLCRLHWAPPPHWPTFVPAVGCPSWPCSAPCDPAWSETNACQRNGPTPQTAAPPHKSWSLRGKKKQQMEIGARDLPQAENASWAQNTTRLLTYLNVSNCVGLSVTKWTDFKVVLLLNVS